MKCNDHCGQDFGLTDRPLICIVSLQDTEPISLAVCAAGKDIPFPEAPAPPVIDSKSKGQAVAKQPPKNQAPASVASNVLPPSTVMSAVERSLSDAEAAAKAVAKAFYSARDPKRTLTRPDQIPENQEDLMKRVMEKLDVLKQQGVEHVAVASRRLRAQVWCSGCTYS
jgi:hypothetical protein